MHVSQGNRCQKFLLTEMKPPEVFFPMFSKLQALFELLNNFILYLTFKGLFHYIKLMSYSWAIIVSLMVVCPLVPCEGTKAALSLHNLTHCCPT